MLTVVRASLAALFLYFPCPCLSARRRFAEGAPLAGFWQYVSSSHHKKTAKTRRKHGFLPFFLCFLPFPLAIILREPCQKPNLKPNFLCNRFYRRFCFLFKTLAADRLSAAIFPSERKNIFLFCYVKFFYGIDINFLVWYNCATMEV